MIRTESDHDNGEPDQCATRLRMAVSSSASSINFLLFVVQLLLILSGDVEVNPGPLDQGI